MEIHQVLVSASPADAITNEALGIRDLLRRAVPSEVFALHVHPALEDEVHELARFDARTGPRPRDNMIVFHASIGEPQVFGFITRRPERLVLRYHNISPAEAFAPYEPSFAGLLEAGRRDLVLLRDQVLVALADSAFNASELVALDYGDVRVSPLLFDPRALHDVELDEGTTHHLSTQVEGPMLLFVGQILPHKRPDFLVQAFHILSTYLVPEAHLVMVGSPRLPRYRAAIQDLVSELGLHRAWITGSIPDETLRSFYARADTFVTASDHEGFCVPPLEAMSFDVPVVARATTAIPETAGGAALLIDPADSPAVLAEALAESLANQMLRDELTRLGRERLRRFDPAESQRQFLEHLLSVA